MYTPDKATLNRGSRLLTAATVFGLLFWTTGTARADEIGIWNFNDSNLTVDHGAGTLQSSFSSIGFASGTTVNARLGDFAGQALNLTNQTNTVRTLR